MLSQYGNNSKEVFVAKWKKKTTFLALVNINELMENLVSEVRHFFEICCRLGPLWISRRACMPLGALLQFICMCRQKAHLGLPPGTGRHLNSNRLDFGKKKANHSKIKHLAYSFQTASIKRTVFVSDYRFNIYYIHTHIYAV